MASSDSKTAFRLPWQSGHASQTDSEAAGTAVVDPPAWPSHDLARRQGVAPGPSAAEPADHSSAGAIQVVDETRANAAADEMARVGAAGGTDAAASATATGAAPSETDPDAESAAPTWTDAPAAGAMSELRGRKPTKFLADLSRAMRAAADESRQSTLAQFQQDVTRHVASARKAAETVAAQARRRSDDDMTALREWSKAETARIKQEAEDGAARRRERLEGDLADQAAGLELELERVQAQVRAFEAEMEGFFDRLAHEDDPAAFAAMAEQLPEPPAFEEWAPEMTIALTTPDDTAETAETATLTGAVAQPVDETGPRMPTMRDGDFAAAEAEAAAGWQAGAAERTADQDETAVPTEGEGAGSPWPAPEAATPAPASGTERTQVAVVGLVSVASIATFKRLLSRAPGIRGVQVASGPDGEFVFSATHDHGCDVAAAVSALQGFEIQVVDSGPGVVNAHAVDPEVV